MRAVAALLLVWLAALAARAGDFDYYVVALSWNPSWCATEGEARQAAACAPGAGHGFILHGLWPQFETGWPEFCATSARDPSHDETAAMADIMASPGLARHQWRKHGRCAGLDAPDYFAMARAAYQALALPEPAAGTTTAAEIAALVRALNPGLDPDGLIVTCRAGYAAELRLCLTRALKSRPCGPDVLARACRPDRPIAMPPIREAPPRLPRRRRALSACESFPTPPAIPESSGAG